MKKTVVICMLLGGILLSSCHRQKQGVSEGERQELIKKNALELSRSCPVVIDPYTVLDSVFYEPSDSTFSYFYSIHCEGVSPESLRQTIRSNREQMIAGIREESELELMREERIKFRYVYYLSNPRESLGECTITYEDYK